MTGSVSWEVLIWVAGLLVAAIVGAGGAVLFGVRLFATRDREISRVERYAALRAEAVEARAKLAEETMSRDFNAYKLHVAEQYATKDNMTQAMDRVSRELRDLKELLNQVLLRGSEPHPPQRRSRARGSSGD